jgi:hypothetical protein
MDTEFEYLDNTSEFQFEIGDFVEAWFLSVENGKNVELKEKLMFKVNELNDKGEVSKVALVKGEPRLIEEQADGTIKCPIFNILNNGFVDIANEDGVQRWKSLVPEIESHKTHFLMDKIVYRRK